MTVTEKPNAGAVKIDFDVVDFATYWLPIASTAIGILAKEDAALRQAVVAVAKNDTDGLDDGLDRLLAELEVLQDKLHALSQLTGVAHARVALTALKLAGKKRTRPGESLTKAVLKGTAHSILRDRTRTAT